jgi:hypothetical protein
MIPITQRDCTQTTVRVAALVARGRLPIVPPSDRYRSESEAPTSPEVPLVACPACADEGGEPTGDRLSQLPSGTWVRQFCESCHGLGKLDREGMERYRTLATD